MTLPPAAFVELAKSDGHLFAGTKAGDPAIYGNRSGPVLIGTPSNPAALIVHKRSIGVSGSLSFGPSADDLEDWDDDAMWILNPDGSISYGSNVRISKTLLVHRFDVPRMVLGSSAMVLDSNTVSSVSIGASSSGSLFCQTRSNIYWKSQWTGADVARLTPDGHLRVAGTIGIGTDTFGQSPASSRLILWDESNVELVLQNASNLWKIGIDSCNLRFFRNSNEPLLTLSPGPAVGVGTVAPKSPLHLYSPEGDLLKIDGSNGQACIAFANPATTSANPWRLGLQAGSSNFRAFNSNGAAWTLTTDGRLGVGTSAPQKQVHVRSACNSTSLLDVDSGVLLESGGNDAVFLEFQNAFTGPSNAFRVGLDSNATALSVGFSRGSNSGNALTFSAAGGGGVGISTTLPLHSLHVVGNAHFNGTLNAREFSVGPHDLSFPYNVHAMVGGENLYTWWGDNPIVNSANSNTPPQEPFWKKYTGLSTTSFERLRAFGTATLILDGFINRQYVLRFTTTREETPGDTPTPANYVSISLPVKPGVSHALFVKYMTANSSQTRRWTTGLAYVTNQSRNRFYRLQGRTNSSEGGEQPLLSWVDPNGGLTASHTYQEWQMYSIPQYVVDQYCYAESNDNKSRYRSNLNICVTSGRYNTDGTILYCTGIAMRQNPFGLTFHGALDLHWAVNGGNGSSWSGQWNREIMNLWNANTNFTNIRVPICPIKDPASNDLPDFYFGQISHRYDTSTGENMAYLYLQNPNDAGDVQWLGKTSRTIRGRFGQTNMELYRHSMGLIVPSPHPRFLVYVGGRPHLNMRYDVNQFGNGYNGHVRGFYTEVVHPDGPLGFQPYGPTPITWRTVT